MPDQSNSTLSLDKISPLLLAWVHLLLITTFWALVQVSCLTNVRYEERADSRCFCGRYNDK